MSRFVVLYRQPANPDEFEREYEQTHLPLVALTPGLTRIETSRVRRTVLGETPLFLMTVLYFPDDDTLKTALKSPEWEESGRNLASIGGIELATMFLLNDPNIVDIDQAKE